MQFWTGKFYVEIADWTAANQEQTEAAIQEHFQRIIDLVEGRTLALQHPMPEECRKPFLAMENIISEGSFHQHFQVNLPHRRVTVKSIQAAEFVLYSSFLMEHPEIAAFLKAH